MSEIRAEMYGPRMSMFVSHDGRDFTLLLDAFDDRKQESVIVRITMPRDQLRTWADIFGKAALS